MNKCNGCGSLLQDVDENKIGFTRDLKNSLCERCFRIINYNDYKMIPKANDDFVKILKSINKTKDLVVLVVDLLNISNNIETILNNINNDILLVFSKRDLLPKDIYEEKLLTYANIKCIDKIIVSSKTNYHLDLLMEKINSYKKSNNVYFVGITNAGKSSLINKIIYNYSDVERFITTSNLPSTTLDTIEIKLNDNLTLIDTPGIIDDGNIINYISKDEIKKIIPRVAIKPITYQVKTRQFFVIDELCRIDLENNNITLFMSNSLKIERYYKEISLLNKLEKHEINAYSGIDIVITGLGFIKVTKTSLITIYAPKNVEIYTRNSLI